MKYKIIDLNRNLIQEAKKRGIPSQWGDYFYEAAQIPNAVLTTASNPKWTFGGGIDAKFYNTFPDLCSEKQEKGGGMERIENICFCITVDETLKSSPEIIEKAIRFAAGTLKDGETLVLSGLGTGIGGVSVREFCDVVERVFRSDK